MQGRAMVSMMGENDRLACEALARVAEAVPANEYTAYVKYDAYRHVLVATGFGKKLDELKEASNA